MTAPPSTPGTVGGPYDEGETVVVQASPAAGMKVDYWSDNGVNVPGSSNKTIYTINGIDRDHTIIVHFIDENADNTPIPDNPNPGDSSSTSTTGNTQQGPAGPQGPQGEQGPAGPAGPAGPQGPAGTVTVIDGAGQTVYSGTGSTGGTVIYTGKGSNSIDMPRTGLMDHYNVYKMLGVVILTMFGVLELVSSLNTKRRKVTV